jgi:hypothetical protein
MLKRTFSVLVVLGGIALFLRSVSALGTTQIVVGMRRVGWGFGAIVLLAVAREVVRTLAWMRTVEGPARLRFPDALRARLAGEALSTLLPLGILVGEPAKAAHVQRRIPLARAFSALAVEFAFYCGSLALLFGASVAALAAAGQIPFRVAALTLASAAPLALLVRRFGRRLTSVERAEGSLRRVANLVWGFGARHPDQFWPIVACEVAFQFLAVAEVYITLLFISPTAPTIASAVVLEAVSRVITMVFKILPMRIGVDEAGASVFASRLGLGSATGITLALVRKLRMLALSAIGLLFLPQGWPRRTSSPREPARAYAPMAMIVLASLISPVGSGHAGEARQPSATPPSVAGGPFNPRDAEGNRASPDFGGFANGIGRTFPRKWSFQF